MMGATSSIGNISPPPVAFDASSADGLIDVRGDYFREMLTASARKTVDRVVDKFVATAFVFPMLQKLSDSPFKTERFDGGFAEQVFRGRLNTIYADELTASTGFQVAGVLTQRLNTWLDNQSPEKLQEIANHQGVDIFG